MPWTTLQMEDAGTTPRQFNVFQKADGSFIFGKREIKGDLEGSNWVHAAQVGGISNTTTAETLVAAPGAGLVAYITSLQIMAEALGSATELVIRSGAGGTVIWRTKIDTAGLPNGLSIKFDSPLAAAVNTLLEVATLTASGTGSVYINAQGFIA